MKLIKGLPLTVLITAGCLFATAQPKRDAASKNDASPMMMHKPASNDSSTIDYTKSKKSITNGSVTVEGKLINYRAEAGTLVLKNSDDAPTISIFYTAYFKSDEKPSQ
ncbi:MAG: hypothetical protein ABI091_25270, partial [Ferruginibacter sp.]